MKQSEIDKSNQEKEKWKSDVIASSMTRSQIKKHGAPALLSFFIPGLGQIVKGEVGKGIFIFIGVGIGSLLIIPGVIIWVWQIADAYNSNKT